MITSVYNTDRKKGEKMIKIYIYEPSRKKDPVSEKAKAEYIKRLSRIAAVSFKKVPEQLPENCLCFSSRGEETDSPGLAGILSAKLQEGNELHLILGKENPECAKVIQLTSLPLSPETESVLLLEQIYRAFKIMAGEPYHK